MTLFAALLAGCGTSEMIGEKPLTKTQVSFEKDEYAVVEGETTVVPVTVVSSSTTQELTISLEGCEEFEVSPSLKVSEQPNQVYPLEIHYPENLTLETPESCKLMLFASEHSDIPIGQVKLQTTDNDELQVVISNKSATVVEGDPDGLTVQFRLTARPRNRTRIVLSSENDFLRISQDVLDIIPEEWDQLQTVRISSEEDEISTGNINSLLDFKLTSDNLVAETDLAIEFIDNEIPGFILNRNAVSLTEGAPNQELTLRLNSQPLEPVTLPLEEPQGLTVVPNKVTFTPDDWKIPQTIVLTSEEDDFAEDRVEQVVHIGPSESKNNLFDQLPAQALTVQIDDNDTPAILLTSLTGNTIKELAAPTLRLKLSLQTRPREPVTTQITLTHTENFHFIIFQDGVNKTYNSPLEITLDDTNWEGREFLITRTNDSVVNAFNHIEAKAAVQSTEDSQYRDVAASTLRLDFIDDDKANVIIREPDRDQSVDDSYDRFFTSERGATEPIRVRLASKPRSPVTISAKSDDESEGLVVGTGNLTFEPDNWSHWQTFDIQGVDDDLDDGTVVYRVEFSTESKDSSYDSLSIEPSVLRNYEGGESCEPSHEFSGTGIIDLGPHGPEEGLLSFCKPDAEPRPKTFTPCSDYNSDRAGNESTYCHYKKESQVHVDPVVNGLPVINTRFSVSQYCRYINPDVTIADGTVVSSHCPRGVCGVGLPQPVAWHANGEWTKTTSKNWATEISCSLGTISRRDW